MTARGPGKWTDVGGSVLLRIKMTIQGPVVQPSYGVVETGHENCLIYGTCRSNSNIVTIPFTEIAFIAELNCLFYVDQDDASNVASGCHFSGQF